MTSVIVTRDRGKYWPLADQFIPCNFVIEVGSEKVSLRFLGKKITDILEN